MESVQAAALPGPDGNGDEVSVAVAVHEPSINVIVSMLSARTASVCLPARSSVKELLLAIVEALGLDLQPSDLRIFCGDSELLHQKESAITLEEQGLTDGVQLSVTVKPRVRTMEVPSRFSLSLLGKKRVRSSAFIMRYDLQVDVPGNTVAVELWRKNDHDTLKIDTLAGTVERTKQHWMGGDSHSTKPLGFIAPLVDLLGSWVAKAEPVFDDADRFWKPEAVSVDEQTGQAVVASEATSRPTRACGRDDESDGEAKPRYDGSVPDWFVLPSPECTELVVNAELKFMTVYRVLVDSTGRPIRAAVGVSCPNHDKVEEYLVTLTET